MEFGSAGCIFFCFKVKDKKPRLQAAKEDKSGFHWPWS